MRRLFWASAVLAAAMIASPVANAGDTEIAQSIIKKLDAQKQAGKLKGFSVDLEVQDGVATVRGKVATPAQQKAVLDVARWTAGVTKVRNGITVDASLASQANTSVPTPSGRAMPSTGISSTSVPKVPTLQSMPSGKQAEARLAAARASAMQATQARESKEAEIRAARLKVAAQEAKQRREMEEVIARQMDEARAVRQAAATQADLQASRILKASATSSSNPIPAPPSRHAVATQSQQQFQPLPARGGVPVPSQSMAYQAPMGKAPIYRNPGAPYAVHPAVAQRGQYMRQASHPGVPGANVMHAAQPIAAHPPGYMPVGGGGAAPARYDHPYMPAYSWPSYASYPNYAAVTYPKQYSAQAWPYIGPFHPYPQVPLGWRKVTLEWDDGWWMLDFRSK